MRWPGSLFPAMDAIRDALDDDPNNAGLHRNLAGMMIEACDKEGTVRHLGIVRRLVPNGAISVFVNANPAKQTIVRCRDEGRG